MNFNLIIPKIKTKICSIFARYPVTYKWPSFWWRKCGFSIGRNSIIGPYCLLWANYHTDCGIIIENNVIIGPNVTLVSVSHLKEDIAQYGKIVTTTKEKIIIRNGAWIGAGAIVLPGITINEGAIVGAGAVVTRNVEPYTIVAGVPAKKIGMVK